ETWQNKTRTDRAWQCWRFGRRSRARGVAKRARQAVAAAVGCFSMRTGAFAGSRRERRSAGAFRLLDLLANGRLPGASCLPGLRGRALSRVAMFRLPGSL